MYLGEKRHCDGLSLTHRIGIYCREDLLRDPPEQLLPDEDVVWRRLQGSYFLSDFPLFGGKRNNDSLLLGGAQARNPCDVARFMRNI